MGHINNTTYRSLAYIAAKGDILGGSLAQIALDISKAIGAPCSDYTLSTLAKQNLILLVGDRANWQVCVNDPLPEPYYSKVTEILRKQDYFEISPPAEVRTISESTQAPTAEQVAMALLNQLVDKLNAESADNDNKAIIDSLKENLSKTQSSFAAASRNERKLTDELVDVRRILDEKIRECNNLKAAINGTEGKITAQTNRAIDKAVNLLMTPQTGKGN